MTHTESPVSYRVEHVTRYEYSEDVSVSYGRAHLLPRVAHGQTVIASALELDPGADELRSHVDYYGNTSTYYTVRRTHRSLRITASSEVEVRRSGTSRAALDELTWEAAVAGAADEVGMHEFVLPSPLVRTTASVSEFAAISFTPGRSLGAALTELVDRIHSQFRYVAGSTTVRTTLGEVMHRKQGVCQDFAQLLVGCLRSVGLPARYVSGYIETVPPPGEPKLQGVDASHAWAALGVPGLDWVHVDPTNDQFIDNRYVIAGWGRDYSDVPPLKGVIVTHGARSAMSVHVDVTRVR